MPADRDDRQPGGPSVWAIVVAGGGGARFGGPKQFAELAGRTVAERSVSACRAAASFVVLVVPDGAATPGHGADVVVVCGDSRSASVRAGLAVVPDDVDIVVVHDAARPLAEASLFRAVVAAVGEPGVTGATCAVPVIAGSRCEGARRWVGFAPLTRRISPESGRPGSAGGWASSFTPRL